MSGSLLKLFILIEKRESKFSSILHKIVLLARVPHILAFLVFFINIWNIAVVVLVVFCLILVPTCNWLDLVVQYLQICVNLAPS